MAPPRTRRFVLPASADKPARFWEIRVVEQRCELRFGTLLGRDGEPSEHEEGTRVESFKNPSVAQLKAKTKIRRKRQVGYNEQSQLAPPEQLELELERSVCEELDSREAWAVYADFISGRVPALGERIALALAFDSAPPEQREALSKRSAALEAQRERWMGAELADLSRRRGFEELAEFGWRMGMIDALRLRTTRVQRPQCALNTVLEAVLASPASRFLTTLRLELEGGRGTEEIEEAAQRVVASGPRPALRELEVRGTTYGAEVELPLLEDCLQIAPRLDKLALHGCLRLSARSEHPRLRSLSLHCASDKASWVARLAGLRMPALERLSIARAPGAAHTTQARELRGLFCEAELPALTQLQLSLNREGDAVLGELVGTPLLERLRRLSVANAYNGAAMQILDQPEQFAHLERLHLRGGRIYGMIRRDLRALGNVSFR